ncbi:MAG TPA: hypothetical protein VF043_36675 [Ktedonobacteraceae bacterium]
MKVVMVDYLPTGNSVRHPDTPFHDLLGAGLRANTSMQKGRRPLLSCCFDAFAPSDSAGSLAGVVQG